MPGLARIKQNRDYASELTAAHKWNALFCLKKKTAVKKKVSRVSVGERVAFKCAHKCNALRPNALNRFLSRHTYSDTLNRSP